MIHNFLEGCRVLGAATAIGLLLFAAVAIASALSRIPRAFRRKK